MMQRSEVLTNEIPIIGNAKVDMKKLVSDIHNYQIYVNQQDNLNVTDRMKFEKLHQELAIIDDESIKTGLQLLSEERKNGKFKQILSEIKDDIKIVNKRSKITKSDADTAQPVMKKRGRKPKCTSVGSTESSSVSTKFLDKYNLPDNVKVTTARLFSLYSQGEVKKVSKRKSTLFMAIKEAYKEHGINYTPR